ncbi:MAG: BamA/TamA family outer membrane protein [Bacteroidota bacterium]
MTFHLLKILVLIFPVLFFAQEKKYELTTLEFVGNKYISTKSLASAIYSKESPGRLSQFLNKFTSIGGNAIFFDSLLIKPDIDVLNSFYRSKGYFKAKIKYNYVLNNKDNEAKLTYIIEEGEPVYFRSLTVKGCESIDKEFELIILEYMQVDTNRVYEDVVVEDKMNFGLTFLKNNGFMQAAVQKPKVIIDTVQSNKADIEIIYSPGKRYKISDLYVVRTGSGFDKIEDSLIKELVGLRAGDWYSNSDIQRAQVRLFRTNLFQSAAIYSVISDTIANKVPLSINTDIGLMNDLSPEMIMNNEDNTFNLGAGIYFNRKNFLGGARKLTIGTSIAAQNISRFIKQPSLTDTTFYGYFDSRAALEQPFWLGLPISIKLESYYTLQRRLSEGYNAKLFGARLGFDFELPPYVYLNTLNSYLNIERTEYNYKQEYLVGLAKTFYRVNSNSIFPGLTGDRLNVLIDSASVFFVEQQLKSKAYTSTNTILGANFGANKTNDFLYPTSGYALSFVIEDANSVAYLFSKLFGVDFKRPQSFKSVVTASWYPNIYKSSADAFGVKLKVGQIYTYRGDKINIPMSQRLYSGGSNSVRGWGTRELVPARSLVNFNNLNQEDLEALFLKGAATGGFFLFEGSLETRHKFLGNLGTTFFIDYGNTWNDYSEFRYDQLAVSAGFGLRFYTEFIPFRIDFGLKAFDPADKRNMFKKGFFKEVLQIHIGIGEAF